MSECEELRELQKDEYENCKLDERWIASIARDKCFVCEEIL